MRIPLQEISADALASIIESFVLREGTDYGEREFDLTVKCDAVLAQLERGEAELWFDPETETVDIRVTPPASKPRRDV